jgi:phosphoadenosine phosphosulfate reductase
MPASATRRTERVAPARNGHDPIGEMGIERVPDVAEPRKQEAALTTAAGDQIDPREVAAELEDRSAAETIAWALETFHPRLRFACSFQKTSSVTIDLAHRIDPTAKFFYLDTDVLFEETYTTRDALAATYGIEFERYSGISLGEQEDLYGANLWDRQPDACCGIRKVEPMREALSGIDCWVSGIRREDSETRAGAAKFGWDRRFGLWKLNPLADWTEAEVWDYIREHQLPYNPLHDAGYPSIGCTHCTRPPSAGDHPRSGRWADAHKTECGLHG